MFIFVSPFPFLNSLLFTVLCAGYPIVPFKKDKDAADDEPKAFTGQGVSLRAAKKKP